MHTNSILCLTPQYSGTLVIKLFRSIYHIKLKSRLSIRRPSDRHAGNSVVSAWIDVGLGLCKAVVSGMCTHVSISS